MNFAKRLFFLSLGIIILAPLTAYGAMSSDSYTIYADSVGLGGGALATSTSYELQDTVIDAPAGSSTSTSYEVRAGYQGGVREDLSISMSSLSVELGALQSNAVNTVSTVATITSFSPTGYTFSISGVSGTMPAAVADGQVTAGSEEYGLAVGGTNSVVTGDVSVTGRTLASVSRPIAGDGVTLAFKASRSDASTPGSYSQTVSLLVSANF
ncbi:MAG: hypothetical protein HYV42_00355 [Candidatus Magasanikbacteria bacterium]|nr:hypothetical protein [Candidatus Magasanikbacteria bacterium]